MNTLSTLLSAIVLLAAAALAPAQDLTRTAPEQSAPVFLVGAEVHTVSGEVIPDGVVAFNDGVITLVGRRADVMPRINLSPDSRVIDATGHRVYPGLIASNTRLGLTEIGAVRATHDYNETGPLTPEVTPAVSVNPDSTLIPVARSNGILTFASVPSGGRVPGALSVMRAEGWTWEDMTIARRAGIVLSWPNMRPAYRAFPGANTPADPAEAVAAIDALFTRAQAYDALRRADDNAPIDIRMESMRNLFAEAASQQIPLFINANDIDQIRAAVTWAAARGLKAVIVGGRDAPLVSDLLVAHDVPVVLSGTHTWPKRADSPHDDPFTLPKRLADAGVTFAIDTSDRDGNVRNLPYETARSAAFGLDPAHALRSITLDAAAILGVADQLGSIDRGKRATLLVTEGDILEVTTNIKHAFVDGREIDLTNKQTELRDKYREKYRQLGTIPAQDEAANQ
ncbi:MAG: amidohydrolase family protein [Planctomycetota bacterium]